MFDLGLTKMALIGVVALVVLGPERLPGVARTAGALFGRAQRYINDVKSEVVREMELDDLKKMRTEFETVASKVESTIHDNLKRTESDLNDAWSQGTSVSSSVAGGAEELAAPVPTFTEPATPPPWVNTSIDSSRRKNWRVKRGAIPTWYKRSTGTRTYVQSGAARGARHTPATLRRPTRFL
ncbi:Twin-arginine translocation protein TatB [Candidatus Burkholderia brachyanthoides]|nr:Twin-arginine translocation protein TatB [Candidatus Burkholderia brachyanthoides]